MVTGGLLRESSSRKGPALLVVVPLLGMPMDAAMTYPTEHAAVTTVIEIDAPPATVWQHTVAIPDIRAEELRFTISHNLIGVPKPVDARLEGEGPGAVRLLRWGQGIHFQEHVTEWEQDRRLAWRFHFAPDSIPAAVEAHIRVDSDYLRLEDGDYMLEPLPGNRTRLTLTTRYSMATPFNDYCRWWGERFLGDFHGIVLDVIRNRAEAAAGGA
ncbi:hypothetical protein HMPREF9946_02399 [Acetobacteraceae bacterium AT-5844]|nr:hypothetical protein HMPREF9946_02399 [Acetobacteraceae bacterium AT-5844]